VNFEFGDLGLGPCGVETADGGRLYGGYEGGLDGMSYGEGGGYSQLVLSLLDDLGLWDRTIGREACCIGK
jgi:hypothetical protein